MPDASSGGHAIQLTNDYLIIIREFLKAERRLLLSWADRPKRARPKPPPDISPGAEAILRAVAPCYPPGSRIAIAAIAQAARCHHRLAQRVREWAKRAGRWPYEQGVSPSGRTVSSAKGGWLMNAAGRPDDDAPLSPHEVRRMIRKMIADVTVLVVRPTGRPHATTARAPTRPSIPRIERDDPKLVEVLAQLEAKRAAREAERDEPLAPEPIATGVEGGDS